MAEAATKKRAATGRPPAPDTLNDSQRARRQRIVRAALELLEAGTYDKIQMRDVAVAADVALGTVYRYFSSKEHLFAAVLVEWADAFATRVRRSPARGKTDAERLTAALHRAVSAFEHYPQFFRLITVLEVARDPEVADLYGDFQRGTVAVLAETLRDVPPKDVDAVVVLAGAVLDSGLRSWSLGRMTIDAVKARITRSVELVFSAPPHRGE